MTSRPKQPKYARNKNILVIGGSGSGKTRFFVKPSIMQMHSSYVITDPKGQLLKETGKMLLHGAPKLDENGKPVRDRHGRIIYEPYRIKVLNTINFSKSMKYNPLAYVRSEKDILKLVNVIIANTKGDGEKSSEDFWVKAERLLYCALIGYIWYEAEPEERTFITLLDLLNACEAREDNETYKSPVDILFDDLAKKQPEHFAVKQYVKFKMAAGDARHCLLILDAGGMDGFLVDPQGYNYARYSAFVPNARSLLTPDMAIDRSYISPSEPWRDENRDEMLRMTLHIDGKPDYILVLPADEEYLDAVKAYLDIDVFADAMLCDIRFKVPYIGELIRDTDCPAVEDYNDFAEALEDIWQQDGTLLTYAAVLEAERPDTLRGACELLRNLDNYQRITEDAYGYGQQRLQETLGLDDEAIYELEGYMDFERYGQDCMENDCVTKTEFGLLRRLDSPFPEQRQGQQMFQ